MALMEWLKKRMAGDETAELSVSADECAGEALIEFHNNQIESATQLLRG